MNWWKTSAPLAAPVDLKANNDQLVKQNNVNSDAGTPVTGNPTFASTPTRQNSLNSIFGLDQITTSVPCYGFPDMLDAFQPNYDFFNSRLPVSYDLPSVNNVNRYK